MINGSPARGHPADARPRLAADDRGLRAAQRRASYASTSTTSTSGSTAAARRSRCTDGVLGEARWTKERLARRAPGACRTATAACRCSSAVRTRTRASRCESFLTDLTFLASTATHLARVEEQLANARASGWQRVVESNESATGQPDQNHRRARPSRRPRTQARTVQPDRRAGALGAAAHAKARPRSRRARSALTRSDARGEPITFQAVARAAGVSRQWLYTQPELRTEIEQLARRRPTATGDRPMPARERAERELAAASQPRAAGREPATTRGNRGARDKSSPSRSATFEPATVAAATALHERGGLDPLTPRHGGQQRRTADNALRRGQAGSPNDVDDAALATQDNEQEGGVGDRQLVPAVDRRRVARRLRGCAAISGRAPRLVGTGRVGRWPPADAVRQPSGNASARAAGPVPYMSMTVEGAGQSRASKRFERLAAAPAGVGARPVRRRRRPAVSRRQARIASRTHSRVRVGAIAPGWQRLQYSYASPLPPRAAVGAPQPRHTPW